MTIIKLSKCPRTIYPPGKQITRPTIRCPNRISMAPQDELGNALGPIFCSGNALWEYCKARRLEINKDSFVCILYDRLFSGNWARSEKKEKGEEEGKSG